MGRPAASRAGVGGLDRYFTATRAVPPSVTVNGTGAEPGHASVPATGGKFVRRTVDEERESSPRFPQMRNARRPRPRHDACERPGLEPLRNDVDVERAPGRECDRERRAGDGYAFVRRRGVASPGARHDRVRTRLERRDLAAAGTVETGVRREDFGPRSVGDHHGEVGERRAEERVTARHVQTISTCERDHELVRLIACHGARLDDVATPSRRQGERPGLEPRELEAARIVRRRVVRHAEGSARCHGFDGNRRVRERLLGAGRDDAPGEAPGGEDDLERPISCEVDLLLGRLGAGQPALSVHEIGPGLEAEHPKRPGRVCRTAAVRRDVGTGATREDVHSLDSLSLLDDAHGEREPCLEGQLDVDRALLRDIDGLRHVPGVRRVVVPDSRECLRAARRDVASLEPAVRNLLSGGPCFSAHPRAQLPPFVGRQARDRQNDGRAAADHHPHVVACLVGLERHVDGFRPPTRASGREREAAGEEVREAHAAVGPAHAPRVAPRLAARSERHLGAGHRLASGGDDDGGDGRADRHLQLERAARLAHLDGFVGGHEVRRRRRDAHLSRREALELEGAVGIRRRPRRRRFGGNVGTRDRRAAARLHHAPLERRAAREPHLDSFFRLAFLEHDSADAGDLVALRGDTDFNRPRRSVFDGKFAGLRHDVLPDGVAHSRGSGRAVGLNGHLVLRHRAAIRVDDAAGQPPRAVHDDLDAFRGRRDRCLRRVRSGPVKVEIVGNAGLEAVDPE